VLLILRVHISVNELFGSKLSNLFHNSCVNVKGINLTVDGGTSTTVLLGGQERGEISCRKPIGQYEFVSAEKVKCRNQSVI